MTIIFEFIRIAARKALAAVIRLSRAWSIALNWAGMSAIRVRGGIDLAHGVRCDTNRSVDAGVERENMVECLTGALVTWSAQL